MGLMPYISGIERRESHGEILVDLKFQPELNTVNMVLTTEEGTVRYHNIRVPQRLRKLLPFVASENSSKQLVSVLRGAEVYSKCRVGDGVVKSFSNKTYTYELDDCYHVLSAEHNQKMSHSVLAKSVQGEKYVKVFVLGSKMELKPQQGMMEIDVDGQRIYLNKNERKEIQSQNRMVTYRVHRTSDDVVVVETPFNRIFTDGHVIEIENTRLSPQGQLTGLCGSDNGDKRDTVLSAQSCSPLTQQQQQLRQQQVACSQPKVIKSQVSQVLLRKSRECSQMKHSMVRQTGRLCISQIPIVKCGGGCAPKSFMKKSVPFTCIPTDRKRVIDLYEEKVRRGDILPELRNMEKAFSSEMNVPVSCAHPGL